MAYIKEDNMLQDLKGLVSIESVSGQPEGELPFRQRTPSCAGILFGSMQQIGIPHRTM